MKNHTDVLIFHTRIYSRWLYCAEASQISLDATIEIAFANFYCAIPMLRFGMEDSMQKTVYEDYKYSMQDTGTLYIGAKYTLGEILEEENITFKFRLIVERYILPEADLQDTLESHLYYLSPESFLVKIYKQIKAKVKISVIEEKKTLTGKIKKQYVTRTLPIGEFVKLSASEKERQGVVIQELIVNKLSMAAF